MVPTRRRPFLAVVGAAAAAGCLGDAPIDSSDTIPSATDATESEPSGGTDDDSDDSSGDNVLRLAAADGLPIGRTVRVHPRPLATLLERGAATGEPVRTTDAIVQTGQPPLLRGERTVRLVGDEVDDRAYALDVDGGLLYEWLLGATAMVDPPADAEVLAVDNLSDERRSLAIEAIEGGRATVEPQTSLGTWARTEFVGGYVGWEGDGVPRSRTSTDRRRVLLGGGVVRRERDADRRGCGR